MTAMNHPATRKCADVFTCHMSHVPVSVMVSVRGPKLWRVGCEDDVTGRCSADYGGRGTCARGPRSGVSVQCGVEGECCSVGDVSLHEQATQCDKMKKLTSTRVTRFRLTNLPESRPRCRRKCVTRSNLRIFVPLEPVIRCQGNAPTKSKTAHRHMYRHAMVRRSVMYSLVSSILEDKRNLIKKSMMKNVSMARSKGSVICWIDKLWKKKMSTGSMNRFTQNSKHKSCPHERSLGDCGVSR